MNTHEDLSEISRDEINEALTRFLSKGGKIKKIDKLHNSIFSIDPLSNEGNGVEGFGVLGSTSGQATSEVGSW